MFAKRLWKGKPTPGHVTRSQSSNSGTNLDTSSTQQIEMSDGDARPRIGIDFGTSSCLAAVCQGGVVRVIPDSGGKLSTPSRVAFTDKKRLLGEQAQSQAVRRPGNLLYEVKRLLGRKYDRITEEDKKWWPFTIAKGESGEVLLEVKSGLLSSLMSDCGHQTKTRMEGLFTGSRTQDDGTRFLLPEQVIGMLLAKIKSDAEAFLGYDDLNAAVISVPALYCDRQRSATKLAAELAGFTDVQLVSESTAAALCYAQHTGLISLGSCSDVGTQARTKILVFSLGGGSFEVALITICGRQLTVDSVEGNPSLGGMDFDHKMMELLLYGKQEPSRRTTTLSASTLVGLKTASEKAKKDLSLLTDAPVLVESFRGDDDLNVMVTRKEFHEQCRSLREECMRCVRLVLDAGNVRELREVVLVGGSTRILDVVEMLRTGLHIEPKAHPFQDEAVVRGAALFADYSEQVSEGHPFTIEYFDCKRGHHRQYVDNTRPTDHVLPPLEYWSRNQESDQMCLHVYEFQKAGKLHIPAGTVAVKAGRKGVLPKLRIDRCGILGLDQRQSSTAAVLQKTWERPPVVVECWKQLNEKLTLHERRSAEISTARNQWTQYMNEVEKREFSCPRWLWSTILEWKRDFERWLGNEALGGRVEPGEFTARFDDFRRACRYAFGELWERSLWGRRLMVVDCWESTYVDDCLKNLANRRLGLCDVVVSMRLRELWKIKEQNAEIKGIDLAADCGSSLCASPEVLKENGIPYVLLSACPVWPSADGGRLCLESNKVIGEHVSVAVQAGLRVILRLGRDDCQAGKNSYLAPELMAEESYCEAQLKGIISPIVRDWRNVVVAYWPPPYVSWPSSLHGESAAALQQSQVIHTARHIRKVIGDLVSTKAAETTCILLGGCATLEMWDALIRQNDIDGFFFEGGFRDPLLVEKLDHTSRERTGKILLCSGANGNATLGKHAFERLSQDQTGREEVVWTTKANVRSDSPDDVRADAAMPRIEEAIISDHSSNENERRKVKIIPVSDGRIGEELTEAIDRQLRWLIEELKRADREGEEVVVIEYRPARDHLPVVIEATHACIRRWILTNISPGAAERVRIVCSLDKLAPELQREIMEQPNVDGIGIRIQSTGDSPPNEPDLGNLSPNEPQLFQRRIETIKRANREWKWYITEVKKRDSLCPRWLWSLISEMESDMEQYLAEVAVDQVDIEQFSTRFHGFRRACEYAFGNLWERCLRGRRFLVVDSWESNDVDKCLTNFHANRSRDCLDVVVCMELKELRKTKGTKFKTEGIELAAPAVSAEVTCEGPTKGGISYVLLQAGPPEMGSSNGEDVCSKWNRVVRGDVSLAMRSGLRVVLRLGQKDSRDDQNHNVTYKLEDEKRLCEAQLKEIIGGMGQDLRNIVIAYEPPLLQNGVLPPNHLVDTAGHIRKVIRGFMNIEAAEAVRILIGGCATVEMWDALIKQNEIDGFLCDGGFQDPLLVKKLDQPSQERRGKAILLSMANGNASLAKDKIECLRKVSGDLMPGEELLWITEEYDRTETAGALGQKGSGSVDRSWRVGAVIEYHRVKGLNQRKVKILPISEGHFEEQLSGWSAELKRADHDTDLVVVEYRPALSDDKPDDLCSSIETAHARIRGWLLTEISPDMAEAVHIVYSPVELKPETDGVIMKQPNVDGVSLRLEDVARDSSEEQMPVRVIRTASSSGRALVFSIPQDSLPGPIQPLVLSVTNTGDTRPNRKEVSNNAAPILQTIQGTCDIGEASTGLEVQFILSGLRQGQESPENFIKQNESIFRELVKAMEKLATNKVKVVGVDEMVNEDKCNHSAVVAPRNETGDA
ncbi:hypothetical protein CBR_g40001 [Chara braunii]|uniref:Uncharacterized protein n=1 Tax=Chara braunii TaxID=69332 RepID=A0A388LSQ0_CHABU|nr:hypothetical protein CBR_g40001 [Chara braunii]|eukprot:GBG85358.1 hypothetical protein CBR_g40001 [Chara braunii]